MRKSNKLICFLQANRYIQNTETKERDADTKIHYAVLHSELTGEVSKELEESEKLKYSEDVDKLTKSIDILEKDLQMFKETHEERMESAKQEYSNIIGKLQSITHKLMKSDDARYLIMIVYIVVSG